jgi:signal transduction histidine kinase
VTRAPGAPRGRFLRGRTGPATPIAQDMTAMIHRLLAGYAVVGLLPGVPALLEQAPGLPLPWLVAVCAVQVVVVGGMIVLAVRGRALGGWLLAFAVLTLAAVLALSPLAAPDTYPFLWFHVGLAVVCASVWGGLRVGAAYALALAAAWAGLRLAGGTTALVEAVVEGLFGTSAGLVVGVIALGMLSAARTADELGARLRDEGVRQAVGRALADERARLDQLIHDDVMTTLTAAVQSNGAATARATGRLARETLTKVDALRDSAVPDGALSVPVLASLAEQTARRVSPDVVYVQHLADGVAALRVPDQVSETLLSAVREAVRNAVRHSGASTVAVRFDADPPGDEVALVVQVRDDGSGFAPDRLPPDRLGVRVSMLEACRQTGLEADLTSVPGRGTVFTLTWTGSVDATSRVVPVPDEEEPRLPVDFPAARFTAVTWVALAVNLAVGIVTAGAYRALVPLVVAMVLAVLATALVLRPGDGLRLTRATAAGAVAAVAGLCVAMTLTVPQPALGVLVWHLFSVQLVLVTLVVRRRTGWALLGLAVTEASVLVWSLTGPDGWTGVLSWGAGPVLFLVMAVLVNRILRTISRRQVALRRQEDAAIDASVRQHVALVQRSLWVADLRTQARSILVRLAQAPDPVPEDLRAEALLLEATLRESLVARNVMSDELAVLTEGARRRGVDVRLVDSRHSVVPPRIGQALLDTVRRALAVESVSRLVVRLAPEDGPTAASVLSEDAAGTHLVRLDASGFLITSEVESRGR